MAYVPLVSRFKRIVLLLWLQQYIQASAVEATVSKGGGISAGTVDYAGASFSCVWNSVGVCLRGREPGNNCAEQSLCENPVR